MLDHLSSNRVSIDVFNMNLKIFLISDSMIRKATLPDFH